MNQIIKLFTPPSFPNDEEKNLAARTLHVLHINILIVTLLLGSFGIIFIFNRKDISSAMIVGGMVTVLGAMVLNHKGWVRTSGIFLLAALWGTTVFLISVSGGMRSLDILFFLTGTMIAGITFGSNGAFFYGALSLLTGLMMVVLERNGFVFPQRFTFLPLSNWMILFINIAFSVFPLRIALETLAESNKRARASEERYRLISEVTSDYVFTTRFDEHGNFTEGSFDGAFENITGYTPKDFFAKGGWKAIVYSEDIKKDEWDMQQLQLNKRVVSDIRIVRKDGSIRWVRSYGHPLWDKNLNRLAGIYGAVQDITEQKFAETAYLQSANELAFLYKLGISLTSGKDLFTTLFTLQTEVLKVIDADALFVAIYDETNDIVEFPVFFERRNPQKHATRRLSKTPGLTGAVIYSGKTLYIEDMETNEVKSQYVPVNENNIILHTFLGIPLIVNGKITGVFSVQSEKVNAYSQSQIQLMENVAAQAALTIDKTRLLERVQRELSEREKIQADLRQRAEEMSLLYQIGLALTSGQDMYHALRAFVIELRKVMVIDGFHIGFYDESTDIFAYTLFLNEDEDLNLPPRDLQKTPGLTGEVIFNGRTVYIPDVTDPQAQALHNIIIVRDVGMRTYLGIPLILEDKVIGAMSVQSKKVNGYSPDQIRLLETIAAQVVITSEKSRLLTELQKELVERKILLQEMEIKNAELERFSYTVSHDLRSPLVTIRGFLGFLEKSALSGNMKAFQTDMQRIIKATDRMNQLLRDLLELSRIGRVLNEMKEVPFDQLIHVAVENVQGRLQDKNIQLTIQEDFPVVFVDQPRMIEVLQNLIDNAAKYMGEQKKPQIEIGWLEESQRQTFFVKDNGIGVAPEHHERIFGLFNKLDVDSEGTGVGLALVKRIIEFHGGKIQVKSEAGVGATFYFTLPTRPSS